MISNGTRQTQQCVTATEVVVWPWPNVAVRALGTGHLLLSVTCSYGCFQSNAIVFYTQLVIGVSMGTDTRRQLHMCALATLRNSGKDFVIVAMDTAGQMLLSFRRDQWIGICRCDSLALPKS